MPRIVLLDTGPLGMVSHPRPNRDVVEWIKNLLQSGAEILVPEIADYEVRRELLRAKKTKGIKRLDDLTRTMGYVPITDEALDGDAILAGQAVTLDIGADELVIATTNMKHLSQVPRYGTTFNNVFILMNYCKKLIEVSLLLDPK